MKISLCYRYIGQPYGGNISKLFLSETTKPFESNLVGICIGWSFIKCVVCVDQNAR